MRQAIVFGSLVMLILAGAIVHRARGGDLPRDFAVRYTSASESMQNCYSHVTITGTVRREYPAAHKLLEQQYVYRAAGKNVRLDVTTTANEGMGHQVGSIDSLIATPDGSLVAYTSAGAQVFDTADELSYSTTTSRIEKDCPLLTPFKAIGQGNILNLLQLPGVRIDAVQTLTTKSGEELLRIMYEEAAGAQRGKAAHRSYFVLSPKEGYAVREYWRSTGDGDTLMVYRGALRYDGMHDGAPLVSRIECWQEQGAKRQCILHEVVEVSSFTPVDPAIYYFTAFAF